MVAEKGSAASGGGSAKGGAAAASSSSASGGTKARDAWYTFNHQKLDEVMAAKPWTQE